MSVSVGRVIGSDMPRAGALASGRDRDRVEFESLYVLLGTHRMS